MTLNMISTMFKATFLAPFMKYGLINEPLCTPLSTILNQPIIERNNNNEVIAADGTDGTGLKTGDLNLWSNNTLVLGNVNGNVVGTSSGACILLPGSKEWQCVFELNFSGNGGGISIAGISNNSNEPKSLAITGGTRCFEGATGTIQMTALNIDSQFDAIKYELI